MPKLKARWSARHNRPLPESVQQLDWLWRGNLATPLVQFTLSKFENIWWAAGTQAHVDGVMMVIRRVQIDELQIIGIF